MAIRVTKFDAADYLDTDEARAAYLTEALATGDAGFVAHAIGTIARAKGMAAVAKKAKLSREGLYRTLSNKGNPELDTLLKVFQALNIALTASPAGHATRARPRRRKAA